MKLIQEISINEYNYELPNERIAISPLPKRDESKLLVYKNGLISDNIFKDLVQLFESPVLFVRNNTRVIQARLQFLTKSGNVIELFLLEPLNNPIEAVLHQCEEATFRCMVGNKKKWTVGEILEQTREFDSTHVLLQANLIEIAANEYAVRLNWNSPHDASQIINLFGLTPLPPYIKRKADESDKESYQTVYSHIEGSVAAPTAGLHFTQDLIDALVQKGHQFCDITLHVGAGTFKPVQSDNAAEHQMHGEEIHISAKAVNQIYEAVINKIPIIAIGTTSMRSLETLFGWGIQIQYQKINKPHYFFLSQWEVYSYNNYERADSILAVMNYIKDCELNQISGRTHLMIVPGHEFEMCDGLITNFHQPKSTLLLLVSAFIGNDWKKVYDHALQNGYRFLSYGDASLLWNNTTV
jgi:S-adenosylmethionine:tRNA ribosyltransferase-isomerase